MRDERYYDISSRASAAGLLRRKKRQGFAEEIPESQRGGRKIAKEITDSELLTCAFLCGFASFAFKDLDAPPGVLRAPGVAIVCLPPSAYSTVAPESLITFAQRATSSRM